MLSSVSSSSSARPTTSYDQSSPTPTVLEGLVDELRDARRVLSQGQEEDLRYALDRALNKVEELSSLLKTAFKTQTELETQLNIAKSNLQLVIANNEMLEEALKRETPCNARDVGWRRWSAREVQDYNEKMSMSEDRPRSLDYGPLNESGTPSTPSGAAVVLVNGVKPPACTGTTQPTTPMTTQESRFFRFRFSSGGSDTSTYTLGLAHSQTGTRSPAPSPHPSHLTSPSLSSLVPNAREKEIEELQEQLERERQAHRAADTAKAALEAELESLSQALFEEANKMVATERMRRAETEEELNQARLEKDALRQALKLIEGENGRLRTANASHLDLTSQSNAGSSTDLTSLSPPSGLLTPDAPPYGVPDHLTSFVLEPAPKPPSAGLQRKPISTENPGAADLSASPRKEVLPQVVTLPPVPLLSDDPSPWADVAS